MAHPRSILAAPPLSPAWLDAIDAVARHALGRDDRKGDALVEEIRRLSLRYTRRGGELRLQSTELAARLRFFLPRDLPKIGGPLAELGAAGLLPPGPVWRVLDLGAGLGATCLGVSAFAKASGAAERLDVLASDSDTRALDVLSLLASRAGQGGLAGASVPITLTTRALDLETSASLPKGPFELVVLGLVVNELFVDRDDAIERRAALVRALTERLAPGGAVVVLEPALKETARALHALRDALVTAGVRPIAPCVDVAPCPMLARERDWCHEDLPLALLPPLRALAERAGLRWEGASYAYLTFGERSVADALGTSRAARVVGGPIHEKGRKELQLCRGGRMIRLNVLSRDDDGSLDPAARGTVLDLDREPADAAVHRHGRDLVARVVRSVT